MTEQVGEIASSSGLSGRNLRARIVRDLDHGYGSSLEIVGLARVRGRSHFIDRTNRETKRRLATSRCTALPNRIRRRGNYCRADSKRIRSFVNFVSVDPT